MANSRQSSPHIPDNPNKELGEDFVGDLTLYQPDLHAFINSLLPGDPEVRDVLQRTNITLWKKRAEFKAGTNFKAWAFSVAKWETRAWLTERKRKDWLVFNDDLTEQLTSQFIGADLRDEESPHIHRLRQCLGKLGENERQLVYDYYQSEKSLKECAQKSEKKEGTLRVTLFRIRASLRACIQGSTPNTSAKGALS